MIIAMLLAHLVGDYILQWDALARWKGASVKGVACHGWIVSAVTVLFAVPFDPSWWPWALCIGVAHTAIDCELGCVQSALCAAQRHVRIVRLLIDQTLHLAVILCALIASGYATPATLFSTAVSEVQTHRCVGHRAGLRPHQHAGVDLDRVHLLRADQRLGARLQPRGQEQVPGQPGTQSDRDLRGDGSIHAGAGGGAAPPGARKPAVLRQQSHDAVSRRMAGQPGGRRAIGLALGRM